MRDMIRQIVSAYQSLKLEGQGDGYVLFAGKEPDSKQPVTIQVLARTLGKDPQIAARFRALSQTIRQLNHPNIAAIRDVGEKGGLPYLVTRAIERAKPLADRLNQPWAVDEAADLTMQVGQALEHAYNKGLVHGSLSPERVTVQPDGRVAVNDFGLAQLLDLAGIQLKQAASPYTAPERASGQAPDPRSDVYSLAAILYTLLAHRPPQVVHGQVLAPSRFNADVPPEMDSVVVKALAPNPAERYPEVKSFLAALGAVRLSAVAPAVARARPAAAGQRCPRCGMENQTGRFCRACGGRLPQAEAASAPAPAAPSKASPGAPAERRPPGPVAVAKEAAPGTAKEAAPGTAKEAAPGKTGREPREEAAPRPSRADEPIQITTIDVGSVEVGRGIEMTDTVIATPMEVATGELVSMFPEPLVMPQVDMSSLAPAADQSLIDMPEAPPMPVVDWADIAPPMPEVPTIEDIPIEQEGD
ncbi:MAG: protein kinase [Anaerolineae bacterium]|nr:protein kinase [Anaerolineae bacterium]